jgi:hypothetical protein
MSKESDIKKKKKKNENRKISKEFFNYNETIES